MGREINELKTANQQQSVENEAYKKFVKKFLSQNPTPPQLNNDSENTLSMQTHIDSRQNYSNNTRIYQQSHIASNHGAINNSPKNSEINTTTHRLTNDLLSNDDDEKKQEPSNSIRRKYGVETEIDVNGLPILPDKSHYKAVAMEY